MLWYDMMYSDGVDLTIDDTSCLSEQFLSFITYLYKFINFDLAYLFDK